MNSIKQAYCQYLRTVEGAEIYKKFKRILYGVDDSLVAKLNQSVLGELDVLQRSSLRICDIGGGDGDRIGRIIRFIQARSKAKISLDFVEQSPIYVEEFKRSEASSFCNVLTKPRLFEEARLRPRSYDLVFLIHSIFAFHDAKTIQRTVSLLSDGGKIIIISNAHDSFLGGLKEEVDATDADDRYEEDELVCDLESSRIHFEREELSTSWSIMDDSEDLNTILTWISLGRYAAFSKAHRARISAYIDKKSTVLNGRRNFIEREVVVQIPKCANLSSLTRSMSLKMAKGH